MGDDNILEKVHESIKIILDLSSKIDERSKIIANRQKNFDEHIKKIIDTNHDLKSRASVLESQSKDDIVVIKNEIQLINQRLIVLESQDIKANQSLLDRRLNNLEVRFENISLRTTSSENKWSVIVDFFIKLGWTILAGYILYKFGFPEPL